MLARHRQSLILQAVRSDGSARVSDLTQRLGVSDMTIRRDLEVLARDGLVEKVHGGAVLPGTPASGTRGLDGTADSVVLTGGVRTPSDALVGPVADLTIRSLHFDLLFLGCYGFDVDAGLTTPNLAEAETNRALMRVARRVVVLADHTKWGLVSLSSFARLGEVDVLITDDMLPAEARAQVEEQAGEVVYAESMVHSHVSRQSA
jgi:DeoR/GlpR family transcriptional regulator of sugar metabolism